MFFFSFCLVGKWLRAFLGLSLIPPEFVPDAFLVLMAELPCDDEKYTNFSDYVLKYYASEDAQFPPQIWAAAPSHAPRTTNSAEGFHRQFNGLFHGSHPNIFALKEALLDIQATTYVRLNTIRKGMQARVNRRAVIRVEVAMKAWAEVVQGKRPLFNYLKKVSFMYYDDSKKQQKPAK